MSFSLSTQSSSGYFQSFNPELPAGDQLGIFALTGGALGIPGRTVQGENKRTGLTLQLRRNSGYTQLGPLGDRSFAYKIKVALDPFVIEIRDLSDL